MSPSAVLFAQAQANPGQGSIFTLLLPVALMTVFFYLLIIRPERRKEKQRREELAALRKNDKVVTIGGLVGSVVSINEAENRVVLSIDDDGKVRATFLRSAIASVLKKDSAPAAGKTA